MCCKLVGAGHAMEQVEDLAMVASLKFSLRPFAAIEFIFPHFGW